jgi:hypothetical protein
MSPSVVTALVEMISSTCLRAKSRIRMPRRRRHSRSLGRLFALLGGLKELAPGTRFGSRRPPVLLWLNNRLGRRCGGGRFRRQ